MLDRIAMSLFVAFVSLWTIRLSAQWWSFPPPYKGFYFQEVDGRLGVFHRVLARIQALTVCGVGITGLVASAAILFGGIE